MTAPSIWHGKSALSKRVGELLSGSHSQAGLNIAANITHIMKHEKEEEYDGLLKLARKQPGIVEVAKVYGQYEELLEQSREYLDMVRPTESFSSNTRTE